MFGEINGKININKVYESDYFSKFEIGVGAAAAGLAWDTTKYDGYASTSGNGNKYPIGLANGSGLNNNHKGLWGGISWNWGMELTNIIATGKYLFITLMLIYRLKISI